MFDQLNDSNILLYAIKCYDTPNCVMSEFEDDFNRIYRIKKAFTKYKKGKELNFQLILNHIVILYNVFGVECATRLLFYKLDVDHYSLVKPFLLALNYMPDAVFGIQNKNVLSSDIPLDKEIVECLRHLAK